MSLEVAAPAAPASSLRTHRPHHAASPALPTRPGRRATAPPAFVYWLVPVGVIVAVELASRLALVPAWLLPAPSAVAVTAWSLIVSGELPQHLLVSLRRVAIGLSIGASLGLLLGFAVGLSRWMEALADLSLQMLRTIPHLALLPLVIVWFGIGEEAKIFLVALGTLFPTYINTVHGIRNVDAKLTEMAQAYGLTPRERVLQVVLPGALPGILVGLRYAFGVAWLTLVVGETIAASSGIGYLAMDARLFMRTDVILLSVVIYALLGAASDGLSRLMERRFLRWHPNYNRASKA
ncbi:MAG: ABC transporter permease subunit [Chloroflexi bacterium]|nr:ABC transporter permease subunit [Chloroflexota bacterium]MBV9897245.1 ABC transporter permease subunit [Chloroflexota bacterium]